MMIYQVSIFGKVGVHGYNQIKKHKTNVTLHSRFSEWVYFVTDGKQYNFGANRSDVLENSHRNICSEALCKVVVCKH